MFCGNNLITLPGSFGSQARGCKIAEVIDLEIDREEPRESLSRLCAADSEDIARPRKLKNVHDSKSWKEALSNLFLLSIFGV